MFVTLVSFTSLYAVKFKKTNTFCNRNPTITCMLDCSESGRFGRAINRAMMSTDDPLASASMRVSIKKATDHTTQTPPMSEATDNPSKLVNQVQSLAEHQDNSDGQLSRRSKKRAAYLYLDHIEHQLSLSDPMKVILKRQAYADNRAKPVGLFLDRDGLVALQDELKAQDSDEAKRQSFLESLWYWAQQPPNTTLLPQSDYDDQRIPPTAVVGEAAKVLQASHLPGPSADNIEEYVERQFSSFEPTVPTP